MSPFHIMSHAKELQMRWVYLQLCTHEADDAAMAAFRVAHP
jgi:hypothetical protein